MALENLSLWQNSIPLITEHFFEILYFIRNSKYVRFKNKIRDNVGEDLLIEKCLILITYFIVYSAEMHKKEKKKQLKIVNFQNVEDEYLS